MKHQVIGHLQKMKAGFNEDGRSASYQLPVGEALIPINELLGETIRLSYTGVINCGHCGRLTKKSFNQGYCYPCFRKLAQCDSCIVSPEKCHYHMGTCREPEWGDQHCMIDHVVYLANSSGIKVGITRGSQVPTRWIDQGAVQALPIYRVSTRQQSGLVEVIFKNHVADKTNWRAMLKGDVVELDLAAERDRLFQECETEVAELQQQFGLQSIQSINDAEVVHIDYPVTTYPTKVTSLNFDKQPEIEGVLKGIKGQYLMLDVGVLNIRKFGAYQIEFSY